MTTEMKKYVGTKIISARPMTRLEYCNYRGWELPSDENGDDEVYLVEYEKDANSKQNHPDHEGYISMSPKHVFDKAYKSTEAGLSFGLAIEALKKGLLVQRKEWNGNGMFVLKQVPAEIGLDIIPKMQSLPQTAKDVLVGRSTPISYQNQMLIVKADGTADSWVPSSSDIFAEDWVIYS